MRTKTNRRVGDVAPGEGKAPSPLRSAGALHKAMGDRSPMECGGNDAALAGHALSRVPEDAPSPERAVEDHLEPATETRLGRVAELLMGNSPPGETYNDAGVGLPLINGPAEYGPRHPKPVKWTSAPGRICKPGDVLICVRGNTTGRLNIADTPYCIGRGVAAIRGRPSESDTEFLSFVLQWKADRILELATGGGSTFPNINKPQLAELPVPAFLLPEQQAIAGVLRTVQGAKEACEQVLAATRQLKQSLLHHLFTYGPVPFPQAAHVPLKETEIGPVPKHWGTIRLGVTASIGNGSTPKRTEPRYWDGGAIPWLTSAKVHDRTIRQADEFVTKTAREECHLPMVSRGSLVIAITGQGKTLGNAAKLEMDACVSQHLAYVTFHDTRLLSEFVLAFLRLRYDQLQAISRGGGSTKGALTCGFLKRFEVPLPPLPEQREIAAQLAAVDAKLAAEESRRAALTALFQSLLHHLLTGQVRVPLECGGKRSATPLSPSE